MNEAQVEIPKARILMIDDFPENLKILAGLLDKRGYEVQNAIEGKSALKAIQTALPDLILLDIIMPGIDGYQVCQILKANDRTRDIPVIFLSGLDTESDKVKAFKLGAVDYLTKPFYLEEAIVRIETQLAARRKNQLLKQTIQQQQKQFKQTEMMRDRSGTLLKGLLNTSQEGVAVFEAIRDRHRKIVDFVYILASPLAVMIVREDTNKLIGKHLLKNSTDNLLKRLFALFIDVVENCTVLYKEYFYQQDTFQAWFHIVAVKLNDGFIVNFRDITETKQMELELQQVNLELQKQANIDSLTKIANRRRFDEYLSQEWSRCAGEQKPLSLILCDVDFFKLYNDNYGHQAGDLCLTQVAGAMNLVVKRPTDLLTRYGGEEFAIILPFTNSEGGVKVAETIRTSIKQLKIPHAFSQVSDYVTISLGIATIIPQVNLATESLIVTADRALYEAKRLGRDRAIYKIIEYPLPIGDRE
ncbi:MAG: diguanylate cyclase domain-containing protein [Xenococcaceae cyanobacterium]